MSDPINLRIVEFIPRIKGPIQLTAFLFTVLSWALIKNIDPNDNNTLIIVSVLGLSTICIPLAFRPEILELFPPRMRPSFLLVLFGLMLTALIILAIIIAIKIWEIRPGPNSAFFDTKIDENSIKIIEASDGNIKIQFDMIFFPLQEKASTAFLGILTVHDGAALEKSGSGFTTNSCIETETCLGTHVLRENLFIPAKNQVTKKIIVQLRRKPKIFKIWWQYYQKEALKAECRIDNRTSPSSTDGIPYVALFSKDNVVGNFCHISTDSLIFTPI